MSGVVWLNPDSWCIWSRVLLQIKITNANAVFITVHKHPGKRMAQYYSKSKKNPTSRRKTCEDIQWIMCTVAVLARYVQVGRAPVPRWRVNDSAVCTRRHNALHMHLTPSPPHSLTPSLPHSLSSDSLIPLQQRSKRRRPVRREKKGLLLSGEN